MVWTGSDAEKHFEHAVTLSRDALRALLLLNGGAASALIALTDKACGGSDYTWPVLWFGLGAIMTVVTYILAYYSQLSYANHRFETVDGQDGQRSYARHRLFQGSALLGVFVALVCSFAGIATALIEASH